MSVQNPVTRMGLSASQANTDPVLNVVKSVSETVYKDAVGNVGCASNLASASVGHQNCIFIGDNPPASSGNRQLIMGGVHSLAGVEGAYFERIMIRIIDSGGNTVTKYISLHNA